MPGPLDYLIKQNMQMPSNLMARAQKNLNAADKQIASFNAVARNVTSPVQAAMNKPMVKSPANTFTLNLAGSPNISLGANVPSYQQPRQQAPQTMEAPSDWRFQSFHDMYSAHDQIASAISPAYMEHLTSQYGWNDSEEE